LVGSYIPYCRACGVPVADEAALHCTKCGVSPLCSEHFYPATRSCSLCPPVEPTEDDQEPPSLTDLPNGPWAKPAIAIPCSKCGARIRQGTDYCPNCGAMQKSARDSDYAGLFVRVGAGIIDMLAPLVVTGLIFPFLNIPGLFLILLVAYHAFFTYRMGQTPGKMLLGLQVVDSEGNKPTLKQILLREVVGKLAIFFTLFIGLLWIIWEPKRRGWHDYLGGTFVTHKKRS